MSWWSDEPTFHHQWRGYLGSLGVEERVDGIWGRIGLSAGVHVWRPLQLKRKLARGTGPSSWQWSLSCNPCHIASKRFCWWYVTLSIVVSLDLIHCSVFQKRHHYVSVADSASIFRWSTNSVGFNSWTGIGISHFHRTQQITHFHLKMGAVAAAET